MDLKKFVRVSVKFSSLGIVYSRGLLLNIVMDLRVP